MARRTREVLKTYFETGDIPTQEQFGDLIDSPVFEDELAAAIADAIAEQPPASGDQERIGRTLEYFGATAVPHGETPVDNRQAIQDAIDWSSATGGRVMANHGVYGIEGTVHLKSECNLVGSGPFATKFIQLAPRAGGAWVDTMISDPSVPDGVAAVTLADFCLHGGWDLKALEGGGNWDYDPATMTAKGIHLFKAVSGNAVGRDGRIDGTHRLHNLYVERVAGDGLVIQGRGMTMGSNLLSERSAKSGFLLDTFDSFFVNLEAGVCGTHGLRFVNASNNRVSNVKSWYIGMCKRPHNGYAVSVEGSNTSNFYGVNINTQDTYRQSIYVEGHAIHLTGSVDSAGYLWYMSPEIVPQPPTTAYEVLETGNLQYSHIELAVTGRTGYKADYANDLPRLLEINTSGSRDNHFVFWPEEYANTVVYRKDQPINVAGGNIAAKRLNLVDIGMTRIEVGSSNNGRGPIHFADPEDGINHPVNKRAGTQRWDYVNGRPVWASGPNPADPWVDAMGTPIGAGA